MAKTGRHITLDKTLSDGSKKGTKEGEIRRTYLVNIGLSAKIDQIAFIERKTVKDTMFDLMNKYVKAYEKKNGPVKTPSKIQIKIKAMEKENNEEVFQSVVLKRAKQLNITPKFLLFAIAVSFDWNAQTLLQSIHFKKKQKA